MTLSGRQPPSPPQSPPQATDGDDDATTTMVSAPLLLRRAQLWLGGGRSSSDRHHNHAAAAVVHERVLGGVVVLLAAGVVLALLIVLILVVTTTLPSSDSPSFRPPQPPPNTVPAPSGGAVVTSGACSSATSSYASGHYDFYVLALSWSPNFCATPAGQRSDEQCARGKNYGLVVHGLWPQFYGKDKGGPGGWPECCATEDDKTPPLTENTVDSMLDVMPSSSLVAHEWYKHGTCSGMGAEQYYGMTRRAFASLGVPQNWAQLSRESNMYSSPDGYQMEFLMANPSLPPSSVIITCQGQEFGEVRVCLDLDLLPCDCPKEVLSQWCARTPYSIHMKGRPEVP